MWTICSCEGVLRSDLGLRFSGDHRMCAFDVGGRSVCFCSSGAPRTTMTMPGGTIPPHDGHGPLHIAFAISADDLAGWEERLDEVAVSPSRAGRLGPRRHQPLFQRIRTAICWNWRRLDSGRPIEGRSGHDARLAAPRAAAISAIVVGRVGHDRRSTSAVGRSCRLGFGLEAFEIDPQRRARRAGAREAEDCARILLRRGCGCPASASPIRRPDPYRRSRRRPCTVSPPKRWPGRRGELGAQGVHQRVRRGAVSSSS